MSLAWIATDLATSSVLDDLPSLVCDWPLRSTIGQYDTGTAHLFLDGARKKNWRRATLHGGSVLHVYDDTDPAKTPQWSGIVLTRTRNTLTDTVDLSLATGEAYLARRFVGDKTYSQIGQNAIIEDLIASYVADTGGVPFTVESTGGATLRDRTYNATDNASVYQRLQELMAVQGGPEWTVEWRWSDDREHIAPFLVVADRLGASPIAGLKPAAAFTMPGNLVNATIIEDYSDGKGANRVITYSTGEGDETPVSDPATADDLQGRPIWESRTSPSSSITVKATLDEYAEQIVAQTGPGSNAVSLTASLNATDRQGRRITPVFGKDWHLGDDIYYSVGGLKDGKTIRVIDGNDLGTVLDGDGGGLIVDGNPVPGAGVPVESVLSVPGGIAGSFRALAHELTDSTTSPLASVS